MVTPVAKGIASQHGDHPFFRRRDSAGKAALPHLAPVRAHASNRYILAPSRQDALPHSGVQTEHAAAVPDGRVEVNPDIVVERSLGIEIADYVGLASLEELVPVQRHGS